MSGYRPQAWSACLPSAGIPRPAWQSTVRPTLVGEREDRLQVWVIEREALGARVQLDAAGAGGERALGLGQRRAVRVEPAEGEELAA